MKQREKILLAVLLGAFFFWYAKAFVGDVLFSPMRQREQRLTRIKASIGQKQETVDKIFEAAANRKKWSIRSLPPDPAAAAILYSNWLTELANKAKLTELKVRPGRVDPRPTDETYYKVPCDITAIATLNQLCDFLSEFQQAGLLQKIVGINMKSKGDKGDPQLEITLRVEALALVDAPIRKALFSDDKKVVAEAAGPATERKDYAEIGQKNLFVRGFNKDSKQDPAEKVFFVSSVAHGEKREAWLHDRQSGTSTPLNEGGSFSVAGVSGKVVAILPNSLTLLVRDERFQLALGKNLKQMTKLPAEAEKPVEAEKAVTEKPPVPDKPKDDG